jgi:hypothetical protein
MPWRRRRSSKNDAWDFDLTSWIAKGKLCRIAPGDPRLELFGRI